jgi:hypothetical protein
VRLARPAEWQPQVAGLMLARAPESRSPRRRPARRGLRDIDIRTALIKRLKKEFPEDRIVPELGLCQGNSRVDVAVINGQLHGYEIKSERDTLERLPGQQSFYNRVFDRVTIVTSGRHVEKVRQAIPQWWGIMEVSGQRGKVRLELPQPPKNNPRPDPTAVAQLLWRDEALALLAQHALDHGLRNEPRRVLWEALVAALSIADLGREVREVLKARTGWRPE